MGAGSATDMTAFEAVTGVVAQHARPGAIIVEKSTVPCRTAQLVKDTVSIEKTHNLNGFVVTYDGARCLSIAQAYTLRSSQTQSF